jgi:hypothetical protein
MGTKPTTERSIEECDHESVSTEHTKTGSGRAELWASCDDCPAYWTINADLSEPWAEVEVQDTSTPLDETEAFGA